MLVPDLAIEIVSPNDSHSDINHKVKLYLEDGVRLIWIIDPQEKIVSVYIAGSNQINQLSGDAILTGGDVIPGFEIKLSELFA